jgi:hypothetical protein
MAETEGRADEQGRRAIGAAEAETHAREECRLRLGAPEPESRRRRHRQCCPRLGTHVVLLGKEPHAKNARRVPGPFMFTKELYNNKLGDL